MANAVLATSLKAELALEIEQLAKRERKSVSRFLGDALQEYIKKEQAEQQGQSQQETVS